MNKTLIKEPVEITKTESAIKNYYNEKNDAVLYIDPDTLKITYTNSDAQRQLGRSSKVLLKLKPYYLKPKFDKNSYKKLIRPLLDGSKKRLNFITPLIKGNGEQYLAQVFMQSIKDEFDKTVFVSVLNDISAQAGFERTKRENELRFATLLQKSKDPMGIISPNMLIINCNEAAVELFEFNSRECLMGRSAIDISAPEKTTNNMYTLSKIHLKKAKYQGYQRFEWLHKTASGQNKAIEVTLMSIAYLGEECLQVVWRDLTELKQKELKIKQLAYFDTLTGLPNKNLFADRVTDLLKFSSKQKHHVAIIYLELANLEDINQTMGLAAGEEQIKAVSQRLLSAAGSCDALPSPEFENADFYQAPSKYSINRDFHAIARIGTDVFALAAVTSSPAVAHTMMKNVQGLFSQPFYIYGAQTKVNAVAGIALYPQDAHSFETISKATNTALSQAKQNNLPYCYFNTLVGQHIEKKSLIIKRLESTLHSTPEQLSIRFQPQVDLSTGQIAGAEILLRWNDKKLGRILPATFIPYAQERGLINKVTQHIITIVNQEICNWKSQDNICLHKLGIRLAIKISAKELIDDNSMDKLTSLIIESGLSPKNYTLEIKETSLMHDADKSIAILNKLNKLGFMLAIEDFGTGHFPLNVLTDINADILKIDMQFISSMLKDKKSLAIVKTIIAIAKTMGIKTLAQGIESKETADTLIELGCDYGQGYFFSKPLTVRTFEKNWLLKSSENL